MTSPESPTGTTSSPEVHSAPPLERALRFDAVDGLWQRTKDVYYAHHAKDDTTGHWKVDDPDAYTGEVDAAIRAYLTGNGLDESSDEFGRVSKRLRGLSFDHMFTRRWKYGDWVDGDDHSKGLKPGTSGESRVRKLQLAFTGRDLEEEARAQLAAAPANPETLTTPEELSTLRKAKQEAFANKIKGRVFGKKSRELQQAYDTAEKAYMVALEKCNQKALSEKKAELVAAGKTEEEVNNELKAFAKSEAERQGGEDVVEQQRIFVEKSGWPGKLLERYANLSGKKKIVIGLGLSAVALGSGVGIGIAAGIIGGVAGAGVASGGGFAAIRGLGAARTYQLRKAELFKHQPALVSEFTAEGDTDSLHTQQRTFLEGISKEQLANAEKVKKRAVYWALGTTALGGSIGVVSHLGFVDGWVMNHLPGGQIQHWLADNGHRAPWDHPANPPDGVTPAPAHPHEGGGPKIRDPEGGVGGPLGTERLNIDNHFYVEKGSGLIRETYESASAAGYKIDFKTAEELYRATREQFGDNGIIDIENIKKDTYLHGNDLRLSAPGKAVWKDGVADFMEKWLQDHDHGIKVPDATQAAVPNPGHGIEDASTDHFTRVVDSGAGVDAGIGEQAGNAVEEAINKGSELQMNVVSRGEGWFKTFDNLREAGVIDIPREQYGSFLKEVGPKLAQVHYSDGTPVAFYNRFANSWWMYKSPNGIMPADALRVIARYAEKNNFAFAA